MAGQPATLYLIRHGEKPPKQADGDDAPGLSAQGVSRAQGLVQVFSKDSGYDIGLIIAEKPKKSGTAPKGQSTGQTNQTS